MADIATLRAITHKINKPIRIVRSNVKGLLIKLSTN